MNIKQTMVLPFCILGWSLTNAESATISLSTTDSVIDGKRNQGWWSDTLANVSRNDKYVIGTFGRIQIGPHDSYRSHLSFSVPLITETVTSATLRLTRLGSVGRETTDSNGVPINDTNSGLIQRIALFGVDTDAVTLNTVSGIRTDIFDDLGSGSSYGEFERSQFWNPTGVEEFQLNQAALDMINQSAGGYFSIGLSLPSATPNENHYLFGVGFSNSSVQELVLEVPEPGTVSMLCVGLLSIIMGRRR